MDITEGQKKACFFIQRFSKPRKQAVCANRGFRYFIFTLLLKAGKYDNKKNWQSRIRFFKDFTCSGAHLKTGQVLEIIPLVFQRIG